MADAASPESASFCIGRFLIDVPAGSKLSGGNYQYNFARLEKPVMMSIAEFERALDAKEAKLRSVRHEVDPSLLRQLVRSERNSRVYSFWEYEGAAYVVEVEGYKWTSDVHFLMRSEAGLSREPQAVARMADRLARLRARADSEIPTEPGYCFAGGFIADDEWKNEEAGVDIDLPDHPDVVLSIDIFPLASHKHDTPLLNRMGGVLQGLGRLATGVQVLRKGKRQIGPYKGQEYLVSTPGSGGSRAHSFIWETQGEGTLDTPFISIEFSSGHQDANGNPQPTRLTNAQALELWDRIVGSFRLRPVGPAAGGV